MHLFISVVSHLHHNVIINLGTLKVLAEFDNINIICRDNIPTTSLKKACLQYGIYYEENATQQGFATNNNLNFTYCRDKLGMEEGDYFILLNPDVYITKKNIKLMLSTLQRKSPKFAVANLFLDKEEFVHDDNIRLYPKFTNFLKTYLFNDRSTMVNRKKSLETDKSYWASCAFMIIRSKIYQDVKGLDQRYYMYCEDIDFCERLQKKGIEFDYLNEVKAIHFRRRDSKRFLSKYFFWHVYSVFQYSFSSRKVKAQRSSL